MLGLLHWKQEDGDWEVIRLRFSKFLKVLTMLTTHIFTLSNTILRGVANLSFINLT